jgi:hypothetical protein
VLRRNEGFERRAELQPKDRVARRIVAGFQDEFDIELLGRIVAALGSKLT